MPQVERYGGGPPLYQQIADDLRSKILSGELEPGERLPAERDLEDIYGCSRGTVRQALGLLKAEGLIKAEHGRGIFVRTESPLRRLAGDRLSRSAREAGKAPFMVDTAAANRSTEVEMLKLGPATPSSEVAARLQLDDDEQVLVRRRRYFADERPMQVASSYLPLALVEGSPICQENPGPGGIYARLEELGHELSHFEEEIRTRMPLPDEARALQLESGVPVFSVVRTAYREDGRPIEIAEMLLAGDRYVLSYRLPAD